MIIPIHDFHASLATSEVIADETWWEQIYRDAFPYFKSMERVPSGTPEQLAGIDRIIHLKGGSQVTIDEKVRHADYDDILLETYSSVEHDRLGWACKPLACDYIAYAFLPSRRCYVLPFQLLQHTLYLNWARWDRDCKKIDAPNRGYTTRSLAVPIDMLQKALADASLVRWAETTNPQGALNDKP